MISNEVLKANRKRVRYFAHKFNVRTPDNITFEDLEQEGWLGVMEASRLKSVDDECYASYMVGVIYNRMYDVLRSVDAMQHHKRSELNRIKKVRSTLEQEAQGVVSDEAGAKAAGTTLKRYRMLLRLESTCSLVQDGELHEYGVKPPGRGLTDRHDVEAMHLAVARLNPQRRQVVTMRYLEERTGDEVGEVLGVTASRVCQVEKEALAHLKQILEVV